MNRKGVALAIILLFLLALILVPVFAYAETPEERCQRETRSYNEAWESAWRASHKEEVEAGQQPPAPNPPYRCFGTDTPVPTPTLEPGANSGVPGVSGGSTGNGTVDPKTGLPPGVSPLNTPEKTNVGRPPYGTPGREGYNPSNPWVKNREERISEQPVPTSSKQSETEKQGVMNPGMPNIDSVRTADHPLNRQDSAGKTRRNVAGKQLSNPQRPSSNAQSSGLSHEIRSDSGANSVGKPGNNKKGTQSAFSNESSESTPFRELLSILITAAAGLLTGFRRRGKKKLLALNARGEVKPKPKEEDYPKPGVQPSLTEPAGPKDPHAGAPATLIHEKGPARSSGACSDVPGTEISDFSWASTDCSTQLGPSLQAEITQTSWNQLNETNDDPMHVVVVSSFDDPAPPEYVVIDPNEKGNTAYFSEQVYGDTATENKIWKVRAISCVGARKKETYRFYHNGRAYRATVYEYQYKESSSVESWGEIPVAAGGEAGGIPIYFKTNFSEPVEMSVDKAKEFYKRLSPYDKKRWPPDKNRRS